MDTGNDFTALLLESFSFTIRGHSSENLAQYVIDLSSEGFFTVMASRNRILHILCSIEIQPSKPSGR